MECFGCLVSSALFLSSSYFSLFRKQEEKLWKKLKTCLHQVHMSPQHQVCPNDRQDVFQAELILKQPLLCLCKCIKINLCNDITSSVFYFSAVLIAYKTSNIFLFEQLAHCFSTWLSKYYNKFNSTKRNMFVFLGLFSLPIII